MGSTSEIEWEPACAGVRRRVIDTADVTLDHLARYPLMDAKLLKQSIAVQALRDVCLECELLRYTMQEAPLFCSPARSMGNRPEAESQDAGD